jgi:AcrR family transcriptional regulator
MGYVHSREQILDAAVEVVGAAGLAGLTFRSVSNRLGIPDRTVVYYFRSKDELVVAVLERVGEQLQDVLATALGDGPAGAAELLERLWPVLATPEGDAVFRLYFETVGLAVTGREPYRSASARLVTAWVSWVADRLTGEPGGRRERAAALVAVLDGLLLLRLLDGPDAADAARRGMAAGAPGVGQRP